MNSLSSKVHYKLYIRIFNVVECRPTILQKPKIKKNFLSLQFIHLFSSFFFIYISEDGLDVLTINNLIT